MLDQTFEKAFSDAEQSAATALRSTMLIASAAKQMQKAAQEGDIGKLQKASERLGSATDTARQDIANAKSSWSFSLAEAQQYLSDSYEEEFLVEAKRMGLTVHSRDSRLLAFPSILQILPNNLTIRIDRKKSTAIRPAHLIRMLLANQTKKQNYPVERFIEAIYSAYKMIIGKTYPSPVILLAKIYEALTLQPGAAREYGKSDFARDIFMLDRGNISTTRDGAQLSLPASTGTKGGAQSAFTFVAPEGEIITYIGIRFDGGKL